MSPGDGGVVLRALHADDVPALVEGCSDPLTRRYTARIPDPYTPEDARRFLALQPTLSAADGERHFAIAGARDDLLLGVCGVHHVDRAARAARCGYWVGPRHRGRGVATRGLRLLVTWAIADHGLTSLSLEADVENVPSQRVAEAAGFARLPGTVRAFIGGAERDAYAYELAAG